MIRRYKKYHPPAARVFEVDFATVSSIRFLARAKYFGSLSIPMYDLPVSMAETIVDPLPMQKSKTTSPGNEWRSINVDSRSVGF